MVTLFVKRIGLWLLKHNIHIMTLIIHEYEEGYKGRFLDLMAGRLLQLDYRALTPGRTHLGDRGHQPQYRLPGYPVALGHPGVRRRIHVPASERPLPDGEHAQEVLCKSEGVLK